MTISWLFGYYIFGTLCSDLYSSWLIILSRLGEGIIYHYHLLISSSGFCAFFCFFTLYSLFLPKSNERKCTWRYCLFRWVPRFRTRYTNNELAGSVGMGYVHWKIFPTAWKIWRWFPTFPKKYNNPSLLALDVAAEQYGRSWLLHGVLMCKIIYGC